MQVTEARVKTINHKEYPYPVVSLDISPTSLSVICRNNAAEGIRKQYDRKQQADGADGIQDPTFTMTPTQDNVLVFEGNKDFLANALKFLHDNHAISAETKEKCLNPTTAPLAINGNMLNKIKF